MPRRHICGLTTTQTKKRDWKTNLYSQVGVDGFDRQSRSGNTFEIKDIFIPATTY